MDLRVYWGWGSNRVLSNNNTNKSIITNSDKLYQIKNTLWNLIMKKVNLDSGVRSVKWHTNSEQENKIKSTTSHVVVRKNIKNKKKIIKGFRRKDRSLNKER